MKEKHWFAAGACKAKILLATAVKNHYVFAATLLLAVGAAVQFVDIELSQPAFAEQSPVAAIPDASNMQQAPSGNSYYRSMSESLSVVASHGSGSGTNSPMTYYRSMSESMSVTTVQGKAPNSYSRSMSEQASLTTGMPSSAPASPQVRATPAPYSASSNQRIDERLSLRNLAGGKADPIFRSTMAGTSIYSTDSAMSNPELSGSDAGVIVQDTASLDGGEDNAGDHSRTAFLRQIDAFNDYILMQKSIQNAAILQASASAVFLIGTFAVAVGNQPVVLRSGRMQKKLCALFLLRVPHDENTTAKKIVNTQVTYVLLLALVIFTVSSIVNAIDPLAGQAFAAITFVNVGAAVTGNGDGTLTPGLPSGLQTNDMIVTYYYTRGTGGSVSISAGWTSLYDHSDSGGRIAVWYRFYQNGDGAPTITSSGLISTGPPGSRDDTIAQVAAWRGISTGNPIDALGTVSTNGSQQNIGAISGITIAADSVIIVVGGKRDDWTSVATLSGDSLTWFEIGEPDTTTGADAGMVWDYAINGAVQKTITTKTFTVTGGVSAAGKGVMFSLKVPQNLQANPSEQLGVTDSLQRSTITARTLSEQLAVTESVSKVFVAALSEQVALAEQVARTTVFTRSVSEQLALTESVSKNASYILSESLAVTESSGRTIAVTIPIADQLGIADTTRKAVSVSLTEQIGFTDDLERSSITIIAMSEQLGLTEMIARSIAQSVFLTEQFAVSDTMTASIGKPLSESLNMTDVVARSATRSRAMTEQMAAQDTITISVTKQPAEQLGMTESISIIVSKSIADNVAVSDTVSGSPVVFIIITDSMAIDDVFTDISIVFHLDLGEPLVLAQSIATNFSASFNQVDSEGIIIGDSVVLSLVPSGQVFNRDITESMSIQDSLTILIVIPPPPPPPVITTMPNLMMIQTEDLDEYDGLTDPAEAVEVDGIWNVDSLDEQNLQSLIGAIGMPVYDIDLEAISADIDDLTMILPTFRVSMNVSDQPSDDGMFLTPTLSNLPAGLQVIIPIDVQASINGAGNLDHLGSVIVTFTPSESAGNFTMLITMLDNTPEDIADGLPADMAAFYVDVSIVGDFGVITPDNSAFFEEQPEITFTITEEWAQTQDTDRDLNNVPIIGLFLLDESTGDWIEISSENIEPPTSAVGGVYMYTASLPHFSTYVFTADEDRGFGGGRSSSEFTASLTESLFVTSAMNTGAPIASEGKIVFKDIVDSLTLRAEQPQPLHQRVITIHDITVAISIADIRSAATFGTAFAALNFEIDNKGSTAEELVLRFWYSDPAGKMVYEAEQTITIGAGESILEEVKIPFSSPGLYNVMIEVESDDGTLSTTDIAVNVPWLTVYLYILIVIAIAVVVASIAYVIYAMRRSGLSIVGDK